MKTQETSKQQINEIKDLMERSSRFLSLSGLSGISAGLVALLGALIAYYFHIRLFNSYVSNLITNSNISSQNLIFFVTDALIILILALLFSVLFTIRRAKRKGLPVWTRTARLMLYSLMVPLATGGIFCAILINYKLIFLVGPSTLIFYGLALLNASKYTLQEIQWLGILEVILGLVSCVFPLYVLIFWIFGFGVLHIIYGSLMYFRYEANNK